MKQKRTVEKINVIDIDEDVSIIAIEKDYVYKNSDKDEFIDYFENLLSENQIIARQYNDNIWRCKYNNFYLRLKFKMELFRDIDERIRAYTILLFKRKNVSKSIVEIINDLQESIIQSDCYDKEYFDEYRDEFDTYYDQKKDRLKSHAPQFIAFAGIKGAEDYIDFFLGLPYRVKRARNLPSIDSVIELDELMNKFINETTGEQKRRFFPIIIWWVLTRQIPMRPFELVSIVFGCIWADNNDKYWIKLPRKKQQGLGKQLEIFDRLVIPKSIYDLIKEYQELTEEEYRGKYLISYKSYISFFKRDRQLVAFKLKANMEQTELGQLRKLLKHFYDEIVYKYFGREDIERIKLGDTRHLAFCNLKIQGYNMLTIARLAGHRSLKSQMHYYTNEKVFAHSKVKALANSILMDKNFDVGKGSIELRERLAARSKLNIRSNEYERRPVEDGWCYDIKFPSNCWKYSNNCTICPEYDLDLKKYPNAEENLVRYSEQLTREIDIQIETMNRLFNIMTIDIDIGRVSQKQQEDMSRLSGQLDSLIDKKAEVEASIKELNVIEQKKR